VIHPPLRLYRDGHLQVSGGHSLHVWEGGNPDGRPAILLHGGPGSGSSPFLARLFDPTQYRIIGFDQRGAGRSLPAGAIEHNTLTDLLDDLRTLRRTLRIDRWLVVGGSWGATLALAHAADLPDAIDGLLLRNVFLARRRDIDAFFGAAVSGGGDEWRALHREAKEKGCRIVELLAELFGTGSPASQFTAARLWSDWERTMCGLPPSPKDAPDIQQLAQRYRVQAHYLAHGCWLGDRSLLERCGALPRVPTLFVHGLEDRVCPVRGAAALHRRIPESDAWFVPGVGHDPTHPSMVSAIVSALESFARHRAFGRRPVAGDACSDDPDQHQ